ncbi:MAG TPA: hypothetical protein VFJ98_00940 [Mycobacteriales bacterium]|nr:hypothetical protein [Mycobacteriales bacterium]
MTPAQDSSTGNRGLTDQALRVVTREASRLPLLALSVGLQAWERTQGLRESALRHGGHALQIAAHTPLGRFLPSPVLDDGAADEAERIAAQARQARLVPVVDKAAPKPTPAAAKPASVAEAEPAAASKAAREVGAPGAVTEKVDAIAEHLDVDEPQSHDDLPIPDFDNVSLGSLRGRLRSLSLEQLVVLREWEQAHAHRLPVITLLDNRIAKVSAEQKPAYPSESAPAAGSAAVEQAQAAAEDEGGTLRV